MYMFQEPLFSSIKLCHKKKVPAQHKDRYILVGTDPYNNPTFADYLDDNSEWGYF